MGYAGAVVLFAMMMMTVIDVIARSLFNNPLPAVTELTSLMLVMIAGLGLGWCALAREHVKVDLVTDRLPRKVRIVLVNVMLFIALVTYAIMTWYTVGEALKTNQYSSILKVPMAPFLWFFWAGLLVFCLCIVVMLIEDIRGAFSDTERGEA